MQNMTELNNLQSLFRKKCINEMPAYEYRKTESGETIKCPMLYKRADLTKWAQEAFDRGEDFFYCGRPENAMGRNDCGPLELQKPKYVYELHMRLTEEEFEKIFSK